MKPVFVISDNITSPIGNTATENFDLLKKGVSAIRMHDNKKYSPDPFYASLFSESLPAQSEEAFTKFEQLLIISIKDALSNTEIDVSAKKTILLISSTKGNISLMETAPVNDELKKRMTLHCSADRVAGYFHFHNTPVIISHACISGLVALITAMRLLQSGQYDTAVVAGADVITQFVLSGFQSFHAVSDLPCRPFDAKRNGITLGEGAATVILSTKKPAHETCIQLSGGAVSNDANHISGPSRTGEELYYAIKEAMLEAGVQSNEIDFISAHGTATVYNDEMEAKAVTLAGLKDVPLNSLKGYYGHTLGAAGLIETVACIHSLKENVVLPTPGFSEPGTTKSINVSSILQPGQYSNCLKTASGFGGCNAAVVLQKRVETI